MQETSSSIPLQEALPREQTLIPMIRVTLEHTPSLRAALPGLAVAVFAVLFGFAMGGIFGLNEDVIKDRLAASAGAVTATVYQGDASAAEPVVAKSWEYMQRAHLHGGGIGTAAIGLIVVMLLIGTSPRTTRLLSLALGLGALGYSVFWMWAGFIAPGLGSTGAAKESLRWLAMPSSGAVMLATAAVAILCVRAAIRGGGDTAPSD
jgi:hypothetical protein